MDLLQLEHFLAVVEEGTFTRAAERVCRTQPAVSQSIKKLEDEVGAPLFARDVHEVSLTEAGRVLADYARRMVGLRDAAMRQIVRGQERSNPARLRSRHTNPRPCICCPHRSAPTCSAFPTSVSGSIAAG